jgi:hypothetical protein
MRFGSRGRPSLAHGAGNRRGRRRGGNEVCGDWSTSSGLEGAVEINGGVVQQVGGGDLLRDNGRRSGSETTGKVAPSKRQRVTGSSSHSTPELRPSSSTSQPRARYLLSFLHVDLHMGVGGMRRRESSRPVARSRRPCGARQASSAARAGGLAWPWVRHALLPYNRGWLLLLQIP